MNLTGRRFIEAIADDRERRSPNVESVGDTVTVGPWVFRCVRVVPRPLYELVEDAD